jgi:hypothetical protein
MCFDCPNVAKAAGGLSRIHSSRGAADSLKGRFSNGLPCLASVKGAFAYKKEREI